MQVDDPVEQILRETLEAKASAAERLALAIQRHDPLFRLVWRDVVRCAVEVGVTPEMFDLEVNCSRGTLKSWLSGLKEPEGPARSRYREDLLRAVRKVRDRSRAVLDEMGVEQPAAPAP